MNNNVGGVTLAQSRFIWTIREFEKKTVIHKNIRSPGFVAIINGFQTRWTINMTFDERDEDGNEYFGIYLESQNNRVLELDLEFSILDFPNEEVYKSKTVAYIFDEYGFPEFIKKDLLLNQLSHKLLSANKLTIICTITSNKYTEVERRRHIVESLKSLRLQESNQLHNLFLKKTFSDVVFEVDEKLIHAHKSIITNRSPVFEAMFKHDMKEKKNNTIIITDISYATMNNLLQFIYCGKVAQYLIEPFKNYKNLMIAADKYGIQNLKMECERRIVGELDVENVFESLNLADKLNALRLKESAIEFIAENSDEIIDSPAYKEFGKLHPDISCEVFRALVIKKRRYE